MSLVTLTRVADDYRSFTTKHGEKVAFKVWAGDDVGEVTTNPETLEKRLAEFRAIVGKPTELVVQDQGTWDDGNPKPKKISFPKEQQQQGQGKRDYVPRWTDTEVGARWADDRIDRRRALELAVEFAKTQPQGKLPTAIAAEFYHYLSSADVEPVVGSPTGGDGMAEADGAGVDGEAAPAPTRSGGSHIPPDGEGREHTGPPALSPEEEQQNAYIQVLRDGPGVVQSVLMARKLYETQVRKIKTLRDLDLNELVGTIQAFKEKVEA